MEHADYLIIGQGIAGILTAFELIKKGRSVFLFDEPSGYTASRVSGAVLNPVNLKNGHFSFPSGGLETVRATYEGLEQLLNVSLLQEKPLFFFTQQKGAAHPLLVPPDREEQNLLNHFFRPASTVQKIKVWQVNNRTLLEEWAAYCSNAKILRQEKFHYAACSIHEKEIIYDNIYARKIIFCEGAPGRENPFFPGLPFTQNRGNVLLLSIPGLPEAYLYQYRNRLIPLGAEQFWLGSNYQWEFNDLAPDKEWRRESLEHLGKWLKIPFAVKAHEVAERPATAGQKPFLLRHPQHGNVFFFNGLGTKGFTLGPYWVQQFLKLLDE